MSTWRRILHFLPLLLVGVTSAVGGAAAWAADGTPTAAAKPRRPNILFILVDDQSPFDLVAYDPASRLETPAIDRLAAEGMTLDGAYHMGSFSGAVCTPSRHMIMLGRTLWHLPNAPEALARGRCPRGVEQWSLPAVFNRAGYHTMRTCKTGNSYEAANTLFTVRHDSTKREGSHEGGSGWHGDRVLDYLAAREAAGDTEPFLIYYGFSHPHDTRDGTPELLAKYGAINHTDMSMPPPADPRQPPLPVNWLPAHPFPHGHPNLRDEVAVSGVWTRRDEQTIRNEVGRQFACSENIDRQIARVLAKLEAMGELENTYVFYTADHGMAIGRHGLQGKQNLYEHTWRVPFIARGPGIPAGSRAVGNVYLLDVLATLCDFAGIDPPETNEGTSFRDVLEGRRGQIRDVLYGCYNGGTKPGMRSVRRGDWKLVAYDVLDGTVRRTQLFNLRENPHEFLAEHHDPAVRAVSACSPAAGQVDLAGDPAHAATRAELEAVLLEEMRRLDDPWRLWNQPQEVPEVKTAPPRQRRQPAGQPAAARGRPPNVVLVMVDDLGSGDLGCYGGPPVTPRLDRMAAEGLRLTNFYVAQAVCTASRAALLTGCYPNRVGLQGALNHTSTIGIHPDEILLPEILRDLGYATAIYGKWHLGTRPLFHPLRHGFDDYLGIPYSNDNSRFHPTLAAEMPPLPLYDGHDVVELDPDQRLFTRRFTTRAVQFIEAHRDRPFFLYLPHVMPHVPIFASDEFRDSTGAGLYADVVAELDWSMGQVLDALERNGLDESTIVIWLSDNGPFLSYGEHAGSAGPFREGKLTSYEGGVRVPCLVRWPGRVPAATVCDEVVTAMDLLPTLAGLCGGGPPTDRVIDGRDMAEVLLGGAATAARDAKHDLASNPQDAVFFWAGTELQAVRSGRWKLHVEHPFITVAGPPGRGGKPSNHESMSPRSIHQSGIEGIASRHGYRVERQPRALYDLEADPGERENVIERHPEIAAALERLAVPMRVALGDSLTGTPAAAARPVGSDESGS